MADPVQATTNPAPTPTVVIPEVSVDRGAYSVKQKNFSGTGQMRGFSYNTPVFKTGSDEEVANSFKAITEKYGEKTVVNLVNSSFSAILAIKARNSLPKLAKDKAGKPSKLPEDIAKNQAEIEAVRKNKPILVTVEEAEAAKPGEKEITLQGLMRKAANSFAEYEKAKAAGNKELALRHLTESQACMAQVQAHAGFGELSPDEDDEDTDADEDTDTEEAAS